MSSIPCGDIEADFDHLYARGWNKPNAASRRSPAHSLAYPYVLRLEDGAGTRSLRLVVIDK
jgi:hypothetical protein